MLSHAGTWVVLHGAALVSGGARRVAVIVEPAHPVRIAPLLMSVYGLTEREQEVTPCPETPGQETEVTDPTSLLLRPIVYLEDFCPRRHDR